MRHDRTSGALYFVLREGEIAETLELHSPGGYMDVDEDGNVVGFESLSVEGFVYFIDSMDGEVSFPDRIEADAFLEPSEYEADASRGDFKEWFESYWLSHVEQDRAAWRSE